MEVNHLDYTPKKRRWLKERGRLCVYVIAPGPEGPTKIGYANDLVARLVTIQSGNWVKLRVYSTTWCVGPPVAKRLEEVVHSRLIDKSMLGEWFDIDPASAIEIVQKIAAEIFPTMTFFDHEAMISMMKTRPIDKRDHVAA